jgi:deoxycytidine triphosphate deaminase
MFLISKFMFDAVYRTKGYIEIVSYEPKNHHSSFYYFRLGAKDQDSKPDVKSTSVIIPKNGFLKIWSLESFKFSDRVLGLFGLASSLALHGLQLIHSPSIDPLFEGSLQMGIRNLTTSDIELRVGDTIGKVLLFDISDSIIEAERFVDDAVQKARLDERKAAGQVIGDAFSRTMQKLHGPQ